MSLVPATTQKRRQCESRVKWAERMWAEVQKEVMRPKQALDVRVASAVRRLWSMDEDGVHLREWAVGSAEAVAGHELRGGSLPATLVGRKRRRVVESGSEEGRGGGRGGRVSFLGLPSWAPSFAPPHL